MMADAPKGSKEWHAREKRAYRSVERKLRNLLARPTRTGEVYVPFTWVQCVDGQEFEVTISAILPRLGARPGAHANYLQTPRLSDPAPDLHEDWMAAGSPEIERLSAESGRAAWAVSEAVGRAHGVYRRLRSAYERRDVSAARPLAAQWLSLRDEVRRAEARHGETSMAFLREKIRLVLDRTSPTPPE